MGLTGSLWDGLIACVGCLMRKAWPVDYPLQDSLDGENSSASEHRVTSSRTFDVNVSGTLQGHRRSEQPPPADRSSLGPVRACTYLRYFPTVLYLRTALQVTAEPHHSLNAAEAPNLPPSVIKLNRILKNPRATPLFLPPSQPSPCDPSASRSLPLQK